jgi:hypothetical protein
MCGGLEQIPFHLGSQNGGIVIFPSIITIVQWNDMSPIPMKFDLNGSA